MKHLAFLSALLCLAWLSATSCGGGVSPTAAPGAPSSGLQTLLTYKVITHPTAVVSPSATDLNTTALKVTASYQGEGSVPIKYIGIGISAGDGEADLVPVQEAGDILWTYNPGWHPDRKRRSPEGGYVTYYLVPTASGTFKDGETYTFTFDNVAINNKVGAANIKITEGSQGNPSVTKTVAKLPQGSPVANLDFYAKPRVVAPQVSKVRLHWSGGPAKAAYELEYYTPQGGDKKIPLASDKGEYPASADPALALEQDTFFYLTATYNGDSVTKFFPVTVTDSGPQITHFEGSFSSKDGVDQLHLSWQAENAAYCLISGDNSEYSLKVESYQRNPTSERPLLSTYTLTAKALAEGVQPATKTLAVVWGVDAPGSPVEVGSSPFDVAVSPNAAKVFVTNRGDATVSVLNAQTLEPVSGSPVEVGSDPRGVAVSPDGARVFVASYQSEDINGTVSVLSTATLEPVPGSPVRMVNSPFDVAMSPDGARVYVANEYQKTTGEVSVLNARTLKLVSGLTPVKVPGAEAIAVAPDGARIFVASEDGSVSVLKAETLEPVTGSPARVAPDSLGVAVSPDGAMVFVTSFAGSSVSVLNTRTLEAVPGSPVTVDLPTEVAISPDGTKVFVASFAGSSVSVLNATTFEPTAGSPLTVGEYPRGVAVSPDGARVFVANSSSNTLSVLIPSALVPVND